MRSTWFSMRNRHHAGCDQSDCTIFDKHDLMHGSTIYNNFIIIIIHNRRGCSPSCSAQVNYPVYEIIISDLLVDLYNGNRIHLQHCIFTAYYVAPCMYHALLIVCIYMHACKYNYLASIIIISRMRQMAIFKLTIVHAAWALLLHAAFDHVHALPCSLRNL